MAGGYAWTRRMAARTRPLRNLVGHTQAALADVCDILTFETRQLVDPDILEKLQKIGDAAQSIALVVLGTSPAARARLLHCLLGRQLLPDPPPRGCRWIRIQYGSNTQVHLTLDNSEFELVEELECNKRHWDTLPVEDLVRQKTDLTTVLEVEINNQFLKDGPRIIIPPDLDLDAESGSLSHWALKKLHLELYTKRSNVLKNLNPVYLYAIDRTGKNIFSDNISSDITTSRSDEDFWKSFNLYSFASGMREGVDMTVSSESIETASVGSGEGEKKGDARKWSSDSREPAVFTGENCLDLLQIKEINPNSQILFVLFSDSKDLNKPKEQRIEDEKKDRKLNMDAFKRIFSYRPTPESSSTQKPVEDDKRVYQELKTFMTELMEQWEMMTSPPQKHYVKSQWIVLDDAELRTVDNASPLDLPSTIHAKEAGSNGKKIEDKTVRTRTGFLSNILKFATDCLHSYLLEYCTKLSEVHVKLLQQVILTSFDMARELQVVPKKIQYVAKQEHQLYETILEKFSDGEKKQELLKIMEEVLEEMRTEVNNMDWSVDDLPWHRDTSFLVSNSIFYSSSRSSPSYIAFRTNTHEQPSDSEEALSLDTYNFDDYDIIARDEEPAEIAYDSYTNSKSQESEFPYNIQVENESAMSSLSSWGWSSSRACTSTRNISEKQASLDVQHTVLSKLSQKISQKLVKFVDCVKVTYFGTLQRCLESLESSCRQELGGRPASEAMRELLSVGRQVDLSPCAAFPLLRSLLESLRKILYKLRLVGGEAEEACCVLSPLWRRRVAASALKQLSPHRLARLISAQILERLSMAHERYQSALKSLESALAGRLHHTEDVKLAIRKKYAPTFARLCLESTSMCDLLMYGNPELGREIGRGQYGVVYSVRGSWAGKSPVAVKSVLPADDRHYKELAMEFFYTRSIPAHPRIVCLYGSLVQRSGNGGPSVLLVTERKVRDLHAAVRAGLSFTARMRVAVDIVEGIRYLHSLGLVHRDIKMKNVLLDSSDRAALSDLGFCAAEALISGSVVGTPMHMAPELLEGGYDASVDVYAFGILFWYLCAGNIKLPTAFEPFVTKEQLWTKVRRGLRPERLPHFSDECWEIMELCWATEPSERALLGDIQPRLERIMKHGTSPQQQSEETSIYENCEDTLDMSGIKVMFEDKISV